MHKEIHVFDVVPYEEMTEEEQKASINDALKFISEVIPYEDMPDEAKKACDKANEMLTPWFTGEYLWDMAEEYVRGFINPIKRLQYIGTIEPDLMPDPQKEFPEDGAWRSQIEDPNREMIDGEGDLTKEEATSILMSTLERLI